MQSSASPAPRIPDYELLRLIGRGGYGDVWLARSVTGAFRAVKFVCRDRFPDVRPYEREFDGISRFTAISLREPSQLALLHVGRDDAAQFFYYVMELADDAERGRDILPETYVPLTLRELRDRRGHLPAAEVVTIGAALARGLATLHASGLVHRDIKPSNVIFVGGVPKLADVGLVATAREAMTLVGTEGYMPPEGPGAPSADVFSLGRVLYELVTGFDRHDFPRLPADLGARPDRSELLELNEVVLRACEPLVENRFADAGALLDELLLLQAGKSVRRLRTAERRTMRALRVTVALTLIAAVAGTGAWVERRRANEELQLRQKAEAERDAFARRAVYSAALDKAQRALEQDDYGLARQFLQTVVPKPGETDLRGFEWSALANDARGDPAVVFRAGGSAGQRVRYSPAANLIAMQSADYKVTLWDATTQREVGRVAGVRELAGFSADGRWLIGISAEPRLRRWLVSTGAMDERHEFGSSWTVGMLPDERWLVLAQKALGQPIILRRGDFASGESWEKTIPFTGPPGLGDYFASALAPDGSACAIALIHGRAQNASWRILVLSLPDLSVRWNEISEHRPSALAFDPSGRALLCGWGDTGEVARLDIAAGSWRWKQALPITQFSRLVHDGKGVLAVGGRSGRLLLLDLETGAIVGSRRGHEADVQDIVFLPGQSQILSTGNGGDVRWWAAATATAPRELAGFWNPPGGGRTVRASADGRFVAATAAFERTRVVQTDTGKTVVELAGVVAPVAFEANSESLWVISGDGALERRTFADVPPAARIVLPAKPIAAASSADARSFVCVDDKGVLFFVDAARQQVSPRDSGHGYPWWVAVSNDGILAASGGRDRTVRLWNTRSASVLAEWKELGTVNNGAFSPDGRHLAVVHSSGMLQALDLREKSSAIRLVTSSGVLQAIAFHPTEPRLFLGGRDGVVHVIDTSVWQQVTQLSMSSIGHAGTMTRADLAGNGSVLAGYAEAGVLRFWRRAP